jgi:hypothetical protein
VARLREQVGEDEAGGEPPDRDGGVGAHRPEQRERALAIARVPRDERVMRAGERGAPREAPGEWRGRVEIAQP